jgi:hypothetical protein
LKPRVINQPDVDQVPKVRAVLVSEGGELDSDQGIQREHAEDTSVFGFGDIRIGKRLPGANKLIGKKHMYRIAWLGIGMIEEDINAGDMAVDEAGGFQDRFRPLEVRAPEQDVHIARIAHGRFIHTRDPKRNGVPAGNRVWHIRGVQCGGGFEKTLAYGFHGSHHPFEREWAIDDRGHPDTHHNSKLMPHLQLLGFQIMLVVFGRIDPDRHLFHNVQAITLDAVNLLGVIGHNPNVL